MYEQVELKSTRLLTVIIAISFGITYGESSENATDSTVTVNKPLHRNANTQPWVHFSSEYVRCFCNLPTCVHTGYMCKSSGGGCFSDLWGIAGFPAGYRGRHGCLELLNKEKRCVNMTESMKDHQPKKRNFKPYMHCCYSDMCNHVDNPQIRLLINSTIADGNDMRMEKVNNQTPIGYSNAEVWFRAATIAVPICGAVILFVLIALAIRILRHERDRSYDHKLGPSMYIQQVPAETIEKYGYKYHQAQQQSGYMRKPPNSVYMPTTVDLLDYHRQFQVPLLVQNEVTNLASDCKNETNAKLNQLHCDNLHDYFHSGGKSIMLEIEKEAPAECPKVNLDKHIKDDVKFSDIKYGDKNYAKDSSIV